MPMINQLEKEITNLLEQILRDVGIDIAGIANQKVKNKRKIQAIARKWGQARSRPT